VGPSGFNAGACGVVTSSLLWLALYEGRPSGGGADRRRYTFRVRLTGGSKTTGEYLQLAKETRPDWTRPVNLCKKRFQRRPREQDWVLVAKCMHTVDGQGRHRMPSSNET